MKITLVLPDGRTATLRRPIGFNTQLELTPVEHDVNHVDGKMLADTSPFELNDFGFLGVNDNPRKDTGHGHRR